MAITTHLTVSVSPSMGDHVFWMRKNVGISTIRQGDIVRFPFSDSVTKGKVFLLKRAACMPGQSLLVDGHKDYFCDGGYLGRAKDKSLKGEPARNFEFSGVIPNGKFFAFAPHKDSYDSRYIGLIDLNTVVAKVYPLF
jgi:conjugal transfer pilin signal peptidase TrbI